MNKQELIGAINDLRGFTMAYEGSDNALSDVLLLEQLDEPKKAELTQAQADMLELCLKSILAPVSVLREFPVDEQVLIMRAYLDGYTIKKEPKWVVSFEDSGCTLYFIRFTNYFNFVPYGINDSKHGGVVVFTDKAKAEAVATLIDGKVEEA